MKTQTLKRLCWRPVAQGACAALLAAGCATTQPQVVQPQTQAAAPVEPTAAEYEQQGLAALEAKDEAKGRGLLEKALAKDAALPQAHWALATRAQAAGDLERAAVHYEALLALAPDHEPTRLNLGKVYRDQQKYEKGIAIYEQALAKDPFHVNYLNNLAVFYRLAKKYDLATQTVRKLLSRTKDNADAYKNLALIAADQNQLRLAEFIGANAKKLDDKDPGVYNNLGLVYMKLGERRLALAQFKKAVELNKDFAPAHANLGALALSYRDYESAARSFERVVQLEPTNAMAHLSLAWSYEGVRLRDGTHRTKDAVAAFEKVLNLVQDRPEAVYGIARACAGELKDLPKAKDYYQRYLALAQVPNREKATKELAVVEQRIKAGAEAERMKREAEEKRRQAEEEKRKKAAEAVKATGSLLDKVATEAEATEPAPGAQPAEGGPPPAEGAAPKEQEKPAAAPKAEGSAAPQP